MDSISEREVRRHELPRRLTREDWVAVDRIARVCFPVRWTESDFAYFLTHPAGYCYGSFLNGTLQSYLLALNCHEELDIISIGTLPERRKQGLAKELLQLALDDVAVERITLEVDVDNQAALKLYEGMGFHVVTTRRGYYDGKRDAFLMNFTKPIMRSAFGSTRESLGR